MNTKRVTRNLPVALGPEENDRIERETAGEFEHSLDGAKTWHPGQLPPLVEEPKVDEEAPDAA